MIARLRAMSFAAALSVLPTAAMSPASWAGEVYQGKTVTVIVPNAPSGLMVQYARMIAPYLAAHLGARDVRVDIQQGAGGLKGTNVLWHSKPDGMTIAFTSMPALVLAQLAGSPGVQFDATKFTYLGRIAAEPRVMVVGGGSKIKSVDDLKKLDRPFVFASQGTDDDFYVMAVLADALGYKLKIVTGYEGNSDTALAVIKGDADGHMTAWTASQAAVRNGDKRVLLTMASQRFGELPDVPAAPEAVDDPQKKRTLSAIIAIQEMGRGFFGPRDMDPAAAKEMRAAIEATLNDPKLIEEAKRRQLPLDFVSGKQQQANMQQIVGATADLVPVLKAALASIR